MEDATVGVGFACADLTTFCRLAVLGLEVTGQRLEPSRALLACRVVEPDQWCRGCGCEGLARDTVTRPLSTLTCPGGQHVVIESLTYMLTLSGEGLSVPINS